MIPLSGSYLGRTVDIEFLDTIPAASGRHSLHLRVGVGGGRIVTGMQKLVQRYVITMLTRLGEIRFDPQFGTEFWDRLFRGAAQNKLQLLNALTLSTSDCVSAMRAAEADPAYPAPPDDERISAVTVLSYDVDASTGTVSFSVQITSAAGETLNYVLPIKLTGN